MEGVIVAEAEAEAEAVSYRSSFTSTPLSSSFQHIQARLIRPFPAATPISLPAKESSSELIHRSREAAHSTDFAVSLAAEGEEQEPRLELETVADEINSSTPLSSFQLIQSRLIRSSPTTLGLTIDQTNQSAASHHLAPLSVYQDCLKQMQAVRSIGRGDVCRRRLFSKFNDLDEAAKLPVHKAAKRARIEDYLDTLLLSQAAQKIRSLCHKQELLDSNTLQLESNLVRASSSFDWPTADLQAMTTSIPTDGHWFPTEQQLLTNDDLQIERYSNVCHKSIRVLFQQDRKIQNPLFVTKDMNSCQLNLCGWDIKDYDHDRDHAHQGHHPPKFSEAQYDKNVGGFTLSPSTPPDNFQSFDTTVSLFQI